MYSAEQIRNLVNRSLQEFMAGKKPRELYEPIQYVLNNGGKRIRPILTLMACNLFSDNVEEAIKPALGFEVFHNFTLLHDDIMDEAVLRRNQLTVHKKWNINTGILSGDVMAILAYEYITSCRDEVLREVVNVFNQTAREVCEGQQYDMNFEQNLIVQKNSYLKMIEMKTSVLLAGCTKVGAIIGGAMPNEAIKLAEFGKNLGISFQLQDDLLDSFGDEKNFGKKIGGDILANKKTYLLIKALEKSGKEQKEKIISLLNEKNVSPQKKIDEMKTIFRKLGVEKETQELINFYFKKAMEKLSTVNIREERKKEIQSLAISLLVREN